MVFEKTVQGGGAVLGVFASGTGTNSVFGPGATDPTFANCFVEGTGTSVTGKDSFSQGIDLASGDSCFSQGYGYGAFNGATGYGSFAQGIGVRVAGDYCFAQGAWYIDVQGDRVFAQGAEIYQTSSGVAYDLFLLRVPGDLPRLANGNVA